MTYQYEIPLSNVINVSLQSMPQGLANFNVNSIAIFSNTDFTIPELYRAYTTPQEAIKDVGSDSLLASMINGLFSPVPNFRTGDGALYIFPFKGEDATAGSLTTADISSNIDNFKNVTNGALNLTIDGVQTQIRGLDFSSIQTIADIAEVIQNQNPDFDVTSTKNAIVFTSRNYGTTSSISVSNVTGKGITDINGSNFLDGANATSVTGTNASGQTLADAVLAADEQVYFGGVLTTQYMDNDTLIANAQALEALDHVYFAVTRSHKNIVTLGSTLKAAGISKTRVLSYAGPSNAKAAIATYATIALSPNFEATNTANTMNLKTLTGIIPDGFLNGTYLIQAQTNGVDVYGNLGGLGIVLSNDCNGYTDDVVNKLWLKKALEVAGFNYLRQTNTKIPQTESGMAGLKNAYEQICIQAVNNGVVAPGKWIGAVPFGDPEDFMRSIEERGYYIYSLPVAQQNQADREQRKAPVVQIALKLGGAIHSSTVIVTIQR